MPQQPLFDGLHATPTNAKQYEASPASLVVALASDRRYGLPSVLRHP